MKRFRVKDNVPEAYLKDSRDFQLLCDLFDLVNSGVKFDIDTITHLSDINLCRGSILRLLQEKLGLSLRSDVTDDTLRMILKCFPFAVRHKGTKRGIAEMVCLFLNILYSDGSYAIEIENMNDDNNALTKGLGNYVIAIITTVEDNRLKELDILEDLLRYVIPTGYNIEYSMNMAADTFESTMLSDNTVYITAFDERKESRMRSSDETEYETSHLRRNLHSIGAIVVRASEINDSDIDDESGAVQQILQGKTYKQAVIPKEDNQ